MRGVVPLLPNELGVFTSTCVWGGRLWLTAMWRSDEVARAKLGESLNVMRKSYGPKASESLSVVKDRTAVSVLPPLAMTQLGAMNWWGPPLWGH